MNPAEYEALCLFLATHGRVWTAHCASMGVSGEQIARALIRQHRRKISKKEKL